MTPYTRAELQGIIRAQERNATFEAAALKDLHAYRAIGMGPSGWNHRDRIAFAELAAILEPQDPPPNAAPPAAAAIAA